MPKNKPTDAVLTPLDRAFDGFLFAIHYCVVIASVLYVTPLAYMSDGGALIWIFGALPLGMLLYFGSRALQGLVMRWMKWERMPYDSMRETKAYFSFFRTLPMLGVGLLAGVGVYFIGQQIRSYYYAVIQPNGYMDPWGLVYEVIMGLCVAAIIYGCAVTKLFPDEIWYTHQTQTITFVLPVLVVLLPMLYFGVPFFVSIIYMAIYFLSILARDVNYHFLSKRRHLEDDKRAMREGSYRSEHEK